VTAAGKTGQRCWGLIPAAGVGRRFGAAVPKQYLELAGRPVIDHAIGALVGHPAIAGCVVVLGADDGWWAQASGFVDHPRVHRACGGAERYHSVRNGLARLAALADDHDWVLVHDAARPCLRRADLDLLLDALAEEPVGALLAVPVTDTVKRAAGERVEETLPRAALWRAYTPQAFRLGQLRTALESAHARDVMVTDDASAIELLGLRPRLVAGRADNIKITRPEDLPLAAFFLAQQGASQC
jgi:2-C-methyl-D-erythritol 4-phosphate cytidylyltransferase